MKSFVVLLAVTAVASASVIKYNKYGPSNEIEVDPVYGQRFNGVYDQYPRLNQFLNKNFWQQQYGNGVFNKQEVYGSQAYFNQPIYQTQEFYGQNVEQLLRNIIFRIFDKQVLVNILNQFGYQQNWSQNFWVNILDKQGVFDYEVLVELINNPVLRNILVQEGIFNKTVLQQIMYTVNIQQSYKQVLLEQLVNRVAFKNWLYNLGLYDNNFLNQILGKTYGNAFLTNEVGQEWLVQVLNNPGLRRYLVQQGIFNEEIVNKFLYVKKSQGVYDENLLRQVVNKQVLRNLFVQHGFVEYNVLNQLLSNEILGLNVLLRLQSSQQVPGFSYRQQVEEETYNPNYVFEKVQDFPVGENYVGIDVRKTIVRPNKQTVRDVLFQNQRYQQTPSVWNHLLNHKIDKINYLSNFNNGEQGRQINGAFDSFYQRQGAYNQLPGFEY